MSDKVSYVRNTGKDLFHRHIVGYFSNLTDNSLLVIGARLERFVDDYNEYISGGGEPISSFDMEYSISELKKFITLLKGYCETDWSTYGKTN